MKNISIRFAWHDNKWKGKIDNDPKRNVYAIGNYSLLSPRVQRRINLDIEETFKGRKVSDVIKEKNYLPPTYWTINALGDDNFPIEDPHPFVDIKSWSGKFKKVPPLEDIVTPFSVFTWCFKISFERDNPTQAYPPPEELEKRVTDYISEINNNKSIAFFYANYSNPITGDDYKFLLLGAGLVKAVEKPQKYKIPIELLNEIRAKPRMGNFPELVWQFKILLDPNTSFVLPYHEYLEWLDKEDDTDKNIKWNKLKEVAIPIEDETLIPHFKYVSLHLPHDKSIYLLYLIRKSLRKIKEHKIVDYLALKTLEDKVANLLSIAWNERGEYPGFKNVLQTILKSDFDIEHLKKLIPQIQTYIIQKYGNIKSFLEEKVLIKDNNIPSDIIKAFRIIEKRKEQIKFLSSFDFTTIQFENVLKIINDLGFENVKSNPYILLEHYNYDVKDGLTDDESDYGLSLYQIDIALIPDQAYVKWKTPYYAESPERLRAVVAKILYDAATNEGSSCLTREEIVREVEDYPLYYIGEKINLDVNKLKEFEKQPIFKEKFIISGAIKDSVTTYQLRLIREVENILEEFINYMLKKKYVVTEKDIQDISSIVEKEKIKFKEKLDANERLRLYKNILGNGIFFLSGRAGSGKTNAIINLIKKFKEDEILPVYVFTPTGKANLVIRNRLKEWGLHNETLIQVSTIHRFLYRRSFDYIDLATGSRRFEIYKLSELIRKLLSGKLEALEEFKNLSKNHRFSPKVIIIDEASMVNEILLATLLSLINTDRLKHVIIVGDERQLPPIGTGRPFIDTIFHLKKNNLESNYIRLESNLRFESNARLGIFSELFSSEKPPFPTEIKETIAKNDNTFEIHYFNDQKDLKETIKNVLSKISKPKVNESVSDMFADVFEDGNSLNLEKVQIITPRRVGNFGSTSVNLNVIRDGEIEFSPRTKLICEENIYVTVNKRDGKSRRILGLSNGSIGYIKSDNNIIFNDLKDLLIECGEKGEWVPRDKINDITNEIVGEYTVLKSERNVDFGYAITVHKSQGSDFDYVLLIIPEIGPFIVRELIYTGLTRAKNKLYLLVHNNLKDDLPSILSHTYENSSVDQRKTLLFGFKTSPFRPYTLTLRNGELLEVKSKIEHIIAKKLDELEINFEYEPKQFFENYHIIPDFKVSTNGNIFYIEHLGSMGNLSYRNRWFQKFFIYKKLGISDNLVTTSESEGATNIEKNVEGIIEDMKSNTLKETEGGYSLHHYYI